MSDQSTPSNLTKAEILIEAFRPLLNNEGFYQYSKIEEQILFYPMFRANWERQLESSAVSESEGLIPIVLALQSNPRELAQDVLDIIFSIIHRAIIIREEEGSRLAISSTARLEVEAMEKLDGIISLNFEMESGNLLIEALNSLYALAALLRRFG